MAHVDHAGEILRDIECRELVRYVRPNPMHPNLIPLLTLLGLQRDLS